MKIKNMKCNHVRNPIGFSFEKITFTWVTEEAQGKFQSAARIEIALDADFTTVVFDSGRSEEIDSLGYSPDIRLTPYTRYYWRVTVWDDKGGVETSEEAWFETAKQDDPWIAEWIQAEAVEPLPLMRKKFSLSGPVVTARAYACGLGLYQLEVNGKKASLELFTPGCNNYDSWAQYQTYDITHLLREGDNAVGALLGPGWSMMDPRILDKRKGKYGDRGLALMCELRITYMDGSCEVIGTDSTWKTTPGFILQSSIYDGEIQDGNLLIDNWSTPLCDDSNWQDVKAVPFGTEKLRERLSLPVLIKETRKPVELLKTPDGDCVLDMGQNMVGWLGMKLDLPKGTELLLQFGEFLEQGNFCNKNLMGAKQEFRYISNGKPCEVRPCFTFYGFRYVKVTGWTEMMRLEDFTGLVIYSDLDIIGSIETANPLVNQLISNTFWGQKGNFLDIPSDCPQRAERLGWTGDAQVFSGTACFNMDCYAFYRKYLYDMLTEQRRLDGSVPHFIPAFRCDLGGAAGWADAATIIPWNVYLHSGDRRILENHLEGMKAWVDYIRRQDHGSRLWDTGTHFGDWLSLDGDGMRGGTDETFLATAYYLYSALLVSKAAKVLGKDEMAEEYAVLAEEVREAIRAEYFTPNGRLAVDTQTASVYGLLLDLVPEHHRDRLVDTLLGQLERQNGHLCTGFLGTPYLCRILSANSCNEQAYQLLVNEECPGWLYPVKLGATTAWEHWDCIRDNGVMEGSFSLNHYSYGSILEWMYRHMLGLNPVEENPGFRRVTLRPQPHGHIRWAKGSVDTAAGRYEVGWSIEEDGLHFDFSIPFNTEARVILPDARIEKVSINRTALAEPGLNVSQRDSVVEITLTCGKYNITYVPETDYFLTYSVLSKVGDLLDNPETKRIVDEQFEGTPPGMKEAMLGNRDITFKKALTSAPGVPCPPDMLRAVDAKLRAIRVGS